MALQKIIKSKTGIDVSYWRIDGRALSIDERGKTMTVALYGFIDKNSTNFEPVDTRIITLDGDNFVEPANRVAVKDSRDWLYPAIQAIVTVDENGNIIDGEFKDAVSV